MHWCALSHTLRHLVLVEIFVPVQILVSFVAAKVCVDFLGRTDLLKILGIKTGIRIEEHAPEIYPGIFKC